MHPGPSLVALFLVLLATPGSCLHAFPGQQFRNSREDSKSVAYAKLLQLSASEHASSGFSRNLSFARHCASAFDKTYYLAPLLVPRLKLAFCYVPKVACTQFKDLINHLNGFPNRSLGFGHDYLISAPRSLHFPLRNVTKDNGWKFATFTRDPALRYLSAFESICVSNDKGHFEHVFECCGPLARNNISRDEMVQRFEDRVKLDMANGIIEGDGHWVAQVAILKQCGWRMFQPNNLDFWGHLSGDVNSQVKDMLRVVNHSDDQAVDSLFPKNSKAGHHSPVHIMPETFFRNLTTLQATMKLYEDDYNLLPGIGCSFTDRILNRSKAGCPSGGMVIKRKPLKAGRKHGAVGNSSHAAVGNSSHGAVGNSSGRR